MSQRPIPEATVGRLPVYLRALVEMAEREAVTVSSDDLAGGGRRELREGSKGSLLPGLVRHPGVGYDVAYLIHQVRRELGLTQDWPVLIAGAGNLGHALSNYRGFAQRGFRIVAIVDADPAKVGEVIGDLTVEHVDRLPDIVGRDDVAIGVICTPATAAQEVADRMVQAGIRSILNFAPAVISVPRDVSVRKVDLSIELQILAHYEQRKAALESVVAARDGRGGGAAIPAGGR